MMNDLNDKDFKDSISQGISLVDFWAPWCGPCQILGPVIEEIANTIGDKANVFKMNIDENPEVSEKYGIMSIPTVMIFKDGEVLDTLVGVQSQDAYIGAIEKALES